MKGNLDARKRIDILFNKNLENNGPVDEYYVLNHLAIIFKDLDFILDEITTKENSLDPSFKAEIKNIVKQALEERIIFE